MQAPPPGPSARRQGLRRGSRECLTRAGSVVIFDGYDELLQATGQPNAGYLEDVQGLQREQLDKNSLPLRGIVTSRLALIDRCRIPDETVVIRLEPFDETRQEKWAQTWNTMNTGRLPRRFELPPADTEARTLAEQPLLLLMLALYEAHGEEASADLGRVGLYAALVRRFARRQLDRSERFRKAGTPTQEGFLDAAMDDLGVVALGMLHRNRFYLHLQELEADLEYFPHCSTHKRPDEQPSALDLLQSFFFIHEARASGENAGKTYEFLHTTFGEFLAARYLLRTLSLALCLWSHEANFSDSEQAGRRLWAEQPLHSALSWTPLFTRRVVVAMLREASPAWELDRSALTDLVYDHLRRTLQEAPPSLGHRPTKLGGIAAPSLLGQLAVYSLNLVTLHAAVIPDDWMVDEARLQPGGSEVRPWDQLTHLWRTQIDLTALRGLSRVLTTRRRADSTVVVTPESQIDTDEVGSRGRLRDALTGSSAIGDRLIHTCLMLLGRELDSREEVLDAVKLESHELWREYVLRWLEGEACKSLAKADSGLPPFAVLDELVGGTLDATDMARFIRAASALPSVEALLPKLRFQMGRRYRMGRSRESRAHGYGSQPEMERIEDLGWAWCQLGALAQADFCARDALDGRASEIRGSALRLLRITQPFKIPHSAEFVGLQTTSTTASLELESQVATMSFGSPQLVSSLLLSSTQERRLEAERMELADVEVAAGLLGRIFYISLMPGESQVSRGNPLYWLTDDSYEGVTNQGLFRVLDPRLKPYLPLRMLKQAEDELRRRGWGDVLNRLDLSHSDPTE